MPDVRSALATALPGFVAESVALLGDGLDNVVFQINTDLLVRFGKSPDPDRTSREAQLLAALQSVSPLPVPEPVFGPAEAQQDCLAYRKLPGIPLIEVTEPANLPRIAETLSDFLRTLHAVPLDQLRGLVDVDDQPLPEWLAEAADIFPMVADRVPARFRPRVERFLTATPPPGPSTLVFSHNDLGIEHVLVDPRTSAVTGVIDWSDAALTDPAYDYGLLFRDLGPAAPPPAELRDRAVFYARCALLEDLEYGLETGRRRYVDKSLSAVEWLFPTA
ncbi:phosphotransferase family protein [Actinoplanes sp. HUAS TT8]|uniref:phosphotransferase family protein n=1 Tax=Actinoplanes sp. HUAS TT8 TaxID=3447453 RepID=UPI003F51B290